jgi:GalNAc-alpha-(1->4)-GalNAc-alpha-(1->3)-diNAcBac-PP-undecaprenol alpha-1,4-N-acetyl-D-galactosaminyltransferase
MQNLGKIKKNILISIDDSSIFGGAERIFCGLINNLYKNHNIVIFSKKLNERLINKNVQKKVLFIKSSNTKSKIINTILDIFQIIIIKYKYKIDISIAFLISKLIPFAISEFFYKTKLIGSEHINYGYYSNKKIIKFIYRLLIVKIVKLTIPLETVKKTYPFPIQKKMIVVNNFIDDSFFKKTNNFVRENIILTIGRLEPQKNHLALIKAFKLFDNMTKNSWILKIYGSGSQYYKLQNFIKENNLTKKVYILPPQHNILKIYDKSKIYICTSDNESFGLSPIEACIRGLIVIYNCDCDGIKDTLADFNNAYPSHIDDSSFPQLIYKSTEIKPKKIGNEKLLKNIKIEKFIKEWEELIN